MIHPGGNGRGGGGGGIFILDRVFVSVVKVRLVMMMMKVLCAVGCGCWMLDANLNAGKRAKKRNSGRATTLVGEESKERLTMMTRMDCLMLESSIQHTRIHIAYL